MKSKDLIKRTVFGAVSVAAVLVAGAAQAALEDRDLDGDTVVDAFYDTDLDITWLRNANVNGVMRWDVAVSWAADFSFAGYEDWRLPTSDTCTDYNCTGSEMGHLWYVELGNSAPGPMTNSGDFQNLYAAPPGEYPYGYWSSTESGASNAMFFRMSNGSQLGQSKDDGAYAMAVTNGDVGMVPEPETYALMLAGLAAVGAVARRNTRRS